VDRLKQLGLSLEEIRQVLPLYAEDTTGLQGKREVMAILERHLADTDQKLAQLTAFRGELAVHIARFQAWLDETDRASRKPVQD
jgi:DNA-binding transcriptional MerR regulator